jgi:hypothetical protein
MRLSDKQAFLNGTWGCKVNGSKVLVVVMVAGLAGCQSVMKLDSEGSDARLCGNGTVTGARGTV